MKNRLAFAISIAVVCLLCGTGCVTTQPIDREYDSLAASQQKAIDLITETGDYEGAVRIGKQMLAQDPDYYLAHYVLACAHYFLEEWELVIQDVNAYAEYANGKKSQKWQNFLIDYLGPEKFAQMNISMNFLLGGYIGAAYTGLERYDDAIAQYSSLIELAEALKKNSQAAEYYYQRGWVKIDQNDYDGAEVDLRTSVKLGSDYDYYAYYGLALVYSMKRDKAKCLEALAKMRSLKPGQVKDDVARNARTFEWLKNDAEFKKLTQ